MRDAFGGRVRAVRGAERVVNVEIRQRCKLLGKMRIVLLFAGLEPHVFQHGDLPVAQRLRDVTRGWTDDVGGKRNIGAQAFRERGCDRF